MEVDLGHQAIVYGRIQEDWEGSGSRWPIAPEYNRAVLEGLPDRDDDWPFLTRHLFAVAPRAFQGGGNRGMYRGGIIHFGASTKDDPVDPGWPERFLEKLEQVVLKRLLWISAKVHFESAFWPERVFLYQVDKESLGGLYHEIRTGQFGERILSEACWERQESPANDYRPTWLR